MKNPLPGRVKTRLAKDIGEQKALEVYLKLVDHTRRVACSLPVHIHVFYSDFIDKDDGWSDSKLFRHLQNGRNLGDRMYHAFENIFNRGYQKAVIIGSDCLELQPKHVNKAFNILNFYKAVIGPARDGGYYLLGMRSLLPAVFKNKTWSTGSVFDDTIRNFQEENITWQELPLLRDVDTVKDWDELQRTVEHKPGRKSGNKSS
ncbi:MAG: TIGR04282 family arsenosugar biosynthesis glycosyltransferase [Balneolales bacterium]